MRRVRAHGRMRAQPGVHALPLQAQLHRVGARQRHHARPPLRVRRRNAQGTVHRGAGLDGRGVQRELRDRCKMPAADRRQLGHLRQGAALRGRRPRRRLRPARRSRRVRVARGRNGSALPAHVLARGRRGGHAHAPARRPCDHLAAHRPARARRPPLGALRPLAIYAQTQPLQAPFPGPLLRRRCARAARRARRDGAVAATAPRRRARGLARRLRDGARCAGPVPVRLGTHHAACAGHGTRAGPDGRVAHHAQRQVGARAAQPAHPTAARLPRGGRGRSDHRSRRVALPRVARPICRDEQAHVVVRVAPGR